jgi:hypothetical protein
MEGEYIYIYMNEWLASFPVHLRLGGPHIRSAHNRRARGRGDCDPAAGQGVKS